MHYPEEKDKLFGLYDLSEMILEDMKLYGINPEEVNNPLAKSLADHFATVLVGLFHILLNNRSRQRRKLAFCFQEWGQLQEHSEVLDLQFHKETPEEAKSRETEHKPEPKRIWFTNYIVEHSISMMIYFLKLGFELDLYSVYEYPVVFWYLDYLYSRWSAVKSANMRFTYSQKLKQYQLASAKARGNARGKQTKKPKPVEPPQPTAEHTFIEAQVSLCRGITRV